MEKCNTALCFALLAHSLALLCFVPFSFVSLRSFNATTHLLKQNKLNQSKIPGYKKNKKSDQISRDSSISDTDLEINVGTQPRSARDPTTDATATAPSSGVSSAAQTATAPHKETDDTKVPTNSACVLSVCPATPVKV